jgi:hypothetical protein
MSGPAPPPASPQHNLSVARIVKDKARRRDRGGTSGKAPDPNLPGGGLDLAGRRLMWFTLVVH